MRCHVRCIAAVMLLLAAPPSPTLADEAAQWASAINKAGRQRMLTQRMIKSYCAIGLDVLPERARGHLREATDLFEAQLSELHRLEVDASTVAALGEVDALWDRFEPMVAGEVTRDAVQPLDRLGDQLLAAAHHVVLLLEHQSGTRLARLVNVAGRQRMLSQRLAKLYLMRSWGLDSDDLRDAITRAKAEFGAGLEELLAAPQNTDEILDELAAVNMQWTWFEFAIDLQGANTYRLVVDDSSESILNGMDSITAMYERLTAP
jgi:nitrate/nitrite-specific signal transduction histidine kinase